METAKCRCTPRWTSPPETNNFLRLGWEGYRHVQQTCQDIALYLSSEIAKMGPFELLTEGGDLPVFAFKLRDDVTAYSVFDLSERLRQRGWQVPAYTFPEDMTDTAGPGPGSAS
jgi:glutamate decarboxylase